jgi:hypothetical protein
MSVIQILFQIILTLIENLYVFLNFFIGIQYTLLSLELSVMAPL